MKKIQIIYISIFLLLAISTTLVFAVNFDFNNDGVVNITDLQNLASHYHSKATYNSTFDLNNDSSVNLFDIVSLARNIGVVSAPEPSQFASVWVDTRSGKAQDIQVANNSAQAESISSFTLDVTSQLGSGNWTNDIGDGLGTRGFYWTTETGGENDWHLYRAFNSVTNDSIWAQFKVYTPAGFDWGTGHKQIVWYRPGTGDNRLTVVNIVGQCSLGPYNGIKWTIYYSAADNSTGTNNDSRYYDHVCGGESGEGWVYSEPFPGTGIGTFNSQDYVGQAMTVTWMWKKSSTNTSYDGQVQYWLNNQQILNLTDVNVGTLGWGELDVGGPTWTSPPANQTSYVYDMVVWSEP